MTIADIAKAVAPHGLIYMGALREGSDTIVLIGAGPDMWPAFCASPEYHDRQRDPLDRWSKRLLTQVAKNYEAICEFPSDGPPFAPFIAWATATGRFWQSPTGMLVHDQAGLMISIRGALRIPSRIDIPFSTSQNPCLTCATKPCETACPVGALSGTTAYDVPVCMVYLRSSEGADCMENGCLVRRVCPVSQNFGRAPQQSGFHMRAFIGS